MINSVPPHAKRLRTQWERERERFGSQLRNQSLVEETPESFSPRSVEERLVQCVWHEQLLRKDALVTAGNKVVEILEPGRWNHGRGPDFQNARIRIAGREIAGDIEIHTESSGWTQHKHDHDFEYNRVVLHVCLVANDDRPWETKQNGERLDRLVLLDYLEPDLDVIRRTINPDEYPMGKPAGLGICHRQFSGLDSERLHQFFLLAGKNRVEDKVERLRNQLLSSDIDSVLYQAMMISAGYKGNKTLYFLLSRRVPIDELREYLSGCQNKSERTNLIISILLHTGSLIDLTKEIEDLDGQQYCDTLRQSWKSVRHYYSDRLIPPTRRWYAGMRPPGFPMRRITAIAFLLHRLFYENLFERLQSMVEKEAPVGGLEKEWKVFFRKITDEIMVVEPDHYFSRHYTLGGKEIKPMALLGEPAARVMLFNVIFPLIILQARSQKDRELEVRTWEALNVFPALSSNSITKMMQARIFADSGTGKSLMKREITQQALYKIFEDCCSWNEQTCNDCTFLRSPLAEKVS